MRTTGHPSDNYLLIVCWEPGAGRPELENVKSKHLTRQQGEASPYRVQA